MILADSFNNSNKARMVEFTSCKEDNPLVVQFASNNSVDFSLAAQKVEKYSSAVNLNCGCPQKWAIKEEIGGYLLNKPNLIYDIVKTTRNLTSDNFPVSVKIRIDEDMNKTLDLVRMIEKSGAKWIDVHGRTIKERSNPVHYDAVKLVIFSTFHKDQRNS
jgi:tRNA-dihydrouridine synthase 4